MFLKFTRLDGSPIWLNATFIVTVEPRRGGGSVVVPIGDGLDYDVREAPERVLAMLEPSRPAPQAAPQPEAVAAELAKSSSPVVEPEAPAAEPSSPVVEPEAPAAEPVVAVPPPKALPEKFEDVVSQGLSAPQPDEVDSKPVSADPAPGVKIVVSPAAASAPAKKTTRTRKTKKTAETAGEPAPAEGEAAAKPKKTTRTRKAKKPALTLDEAQVERLKRMMPGSVKKLQNTLVSQFKVADPESEVKALIEHGVLSLENDHVVYI